MNVKLNIVLITFLIVFSGCSEGCQKSSNDEGFLSSNANDAPYKVTKDLAAFNCGAGHIFDAMRLAKKNGKDPHIRGGNVAEYILKLARKK